MGTGEEVAEEQVLPMDMLSPSPWEEYSPRAWGPHVHGVYEEFSQWTWAPHVHGFTTSLNDLSEVDLVVEAVPESIEIKSALFLH